MRNDKPSLEPGDAGNVRIVQGTRLGDHLYQAILTMIDRQKMLEGARLPPENELATLFGVSRPTVRETLSRLRDDGVIISRRGSGSYVSRPDSSHVEMSDVTFDRIDSFEQIQKCYEFRKAIEGEACYLAATRR